MEYMWDMKGNRRSGMILKLLAQVKIQWGCHFRKSDNKAVGGGSVKVVCFPSFSGPELTCINLLPLPSTLCSRPTVTSPSSPSCPGKDTVCSFCLKYLPHLSQVICQARSILFGSKISRRRSCPLSPTPTTPLYVFPKRIQGGNLHCINYYTVLQSLG